MPRNTRKNISSEEEDQLIGENASENSALSRPGNSEVENNSVPDNSSLSRPSTSESEKNTIPENSMLEDFVKSKILEVMSQTNNGSSGGGDQLNNVYSVQPFQLRIFSENEKLVGHKNFKNWKNMIELELRARNLIPFIEKECGETVVVPANQRVVMDAQTLLYVKSSVSRSIVGRLESVKVFTAFQAYTELTKWYAGSRTQDLVNLHNRFFRLRFRNGFNPDRFIAKFEQLMDKYRNLKTEYSEEYKITVFLQKIDGIDDHQNHFFHRNLEGNK
jgi:hypothetical protein